MKPSYSEIASSFDLWQKYIDDTITSKEKFDAISHADRVALIVETFGPYPDPVPTVDEVLAKTHVWNGMHRWAVIGGSITLTTDQLRPLLEEAYDPADPNWEAMVDAE